jgi:hypothetical protein
MTSHNTHESDAVALRLRPAIVIAIVLVLSRFVLPFVAPDAEIFGLPLGLLGFFGGIFAGFAIAIWWVFFSRAPWLERLGALALMVVGVFLTRLVVDESIRGGMMGMMLFVFSIPVLALALVIAAVVSRHKTAGFRRAAIGLAIFIGCAVFTLLRTEGITGDGVSQLAWRWTPTPEERLLARGEEAPLITRSPSAVDAPVQPTGPETSAPRATAPAALPPTTAANASPPSTKGIETKDISPEAGVISKPGATRDGATTEPDARRAAALTEWPGFRGPVRDGVVRGVQIETDWSRTPPQELWRRSVGPGWSSFAVQGDYVYTQEQRGDEEMVSCYRLTTGQPVWRHSDPARFYESNGGPGPRGTPTLHNGRVYTLGATGIINALDARTGKVLWSRNAATDTGVTIPDWGVASSPLVIDDIVVVAVSGQLIAYDSRNGAQRWSGPTGGSGYSSPHLVTIDGVPQILLLRGSRTISVAPADGKLLWEHSWQPGVGIVQPALATERDVLIATGDAMGGLGIRRLTVAHTAGGWTVEERWTSRGLKPYFNDFVVHKGHAFGFDGSILSSIDLQDGARKWKGGRYGNGQLVLLPDQDLLLVLSEDGELALVQASPEKFTEVARFQALDAKTWNHPAVVGDVLLVRNGEEMAAFRLPIAGRSTTSR